MSDGIADYQYPDWIYLKVVECLRAEPQEVDGYRVYQDIPTSDFLVVRDSGAVTLFYGGLNAINLPAQLAHAVRHDGAQ